MAEALTREEVRDAQRALNRLGVRDDRGQPLRVDGIMGQRTRAALMSYRQKFPDRTMPQSPEARPSLNRPPPMAGNAGQEGMMAVPGPPMGGEMGPGMGRGTSVPPRPPMPPMRDPDSRLALGSPREIDVFQQNVRARMAGPQSQRGQSQAALQALGRQLPGRAVQRREGALRQALTNKRNRHQADRAPQPQPLTLEQVQAAAAALRQQSGGRFQDEAQRLIDETQRTIDESRRRLGGR